MLKRVRIIVPLLVLSFSLLLTVFVVYTAYSLQQRHDRTVLETLADRQTMVLQQFVNSDIHYIGSAANFFRSSTTDDWFRFHTFAQETLKGSQSLIALQWLVKVEHLKSMLLFRKCVNASLNLPYLQCQKLIK